MEGIFFDNGGEFNNEEIREVASILNVRISSTPSESPWSNGLCERNHQITDRMLEILVDENPYLKEKTLLAWANVAKNSTDVEWFQQLPTSSWKKPKFAKYNDRETTSITRCNNK